MRPILILLPAHFLGDWIFQSRKIATTKSKDFGSAAFHAITIFLWLLLAGGIVLHSSSSIIIPQ